jgi:hypothetical protein
MIVKLFFFLLWVNIRLIWIYRSKNTANIRDIDKDLKVINFKAVSAHMAMPSIMRQ